MKFSSKPFRHCVLVNAIVSGFMAAVYVHRGAVARENRLRRALGLPPIISTPVTSPQNDYLETNREVVEPRGSVTQESVTGVVHFKEVA